MKAMRIAVLLFIFLFSGCTSSVHVSSEANTTYSPHRTIAVCCDGDDPLSIRHTLEHLLISKGFNVVPKRVATVRANMQKAEKEKHSIYILRFSYEYYAVMSYSYYMFKKFSASLVDLRNGNVVASADFSQGSLGTKSTVSVLEDFVDKLNDIS